MVIEPWRAIKMNTLILTILVGTISPLFRIHPLLRIQCQDFTSVNIDR